MSVIRVCLAVAMPTRRPEGGGGGGGSSSSSGETFGNGGQGEYLELRRVMDILLIVRAGKSGLKVFQRMPNIEGMLSTTAPARRGKRRKRRRKRRRRRKWRRRRRRRRRRRKSGKVGWMG